MLRSTLIATALALPLLANAATPSDRLLNDGWRFRSVAPTEVAQTADWHPAQVPGVTHLDLLANKLIPDPFYRDNEAKLQWIGKTDWQYEKTLQITAEDLRHNHVDLVFDGLDTLADVSINGTLALHADNQFRTWIIPARTLLHVGDNTISIVFHSPSQTLLPMMRKLPFALPANLADQFHEDEGMAPMAYIRKATYTFGMDWGPRFSAEGIWKNVHLREWDDARIDDLHIEQRKVTAAHADLTAQLTLQSDVSGEAELTLSYRELNPNAKPVAVAKQTVAVDAGSNTIPVIFTIRNPKLWFPNGYGAQDRYAFTTSVAFNGVTETKEIRTGLRSVELRQQPDQFGISFTLVINGTPLFAKGASVIPFDFFPSRVTDEKYRDLLQAAHDSHMNMVRAWGGGNYENDRFYELCDELGLMVWQEFAFNGAMVPGDREFQENVRQEAKDQVLRLREHPSIVLWCGNNELEGAWGEWGYRMFALRALKPADAEKIRQDYLLLFSDIIKSVVLEYGGALPYRPSSPSSDYHFAKDSQTDGDMHYWTVWGQSAPYRDYAKQNPRFMSEYGFQSFPSMDTIRTFAEPGDLAPDSDVMQLHQKVPDGNKRMMTYLLNDYPKPKDFASFVYMSQVQQAEVVKFATEHLRRSQPRTMGALYWQLNDVWPVASWSSIDYAGRWKALQYYAIRFFSDVIVSPDLHDGKLDIALISDKLQPLIGKLRMRVLDFSGKIVSDTTQPVTIPPHTSTLLETLDPKTVLAGADSKTTFAIFDLTVDGKLVSSNEVFFEKFKDLALPKASVTAEIHSAAKGFDIVLASTTFVKDVAVSFGDINAKLDDNFVDLLPNEKRTIHVESSATLVELKQKMGMTTLADAF